MAGKQVLKEHPECVLFHPEAQGVADGIPSKPFQKHVRNVYNMLQRFTVNECVPFDIIKTSMTTNDYSTRPQPFQVPPSTTVQTMHFAALDEPDADGYNIIGFMTFNPCISYAHMKMLAGDVNQVDGGNGRKAKRIAHPDIARRREVAKGLRVDRGTTQHP
eukprot:2878659-Amphidinium_carterae.1